MRTGKLSPEIIRSEKETNETLMPNYTPPDFQEQFSQHSKSNPSDQGTLRNLNLQIAGMGDTKSAAETFEEKIEEINRELKKFDPKAELASNKIADTGKEKRLESLDISDTGKENILEALSIHESTPLVS